MNSIMRKERFNIVQSYKNKVKENYLDRREVKKVVGKYDVKFLKLNKEEDNYSFSFLEKDDEFKVTSGDEYANELKS